MQLPVPSISDKVLLAEVPTLYTSISPDQNWQNKMDASNSCLISQSTLTSERFFLFFTVSISYFCFLQMLVTLLQYKHLLKSKNNERRDSFTLGDPTLRLPSTQFFSSMELRWSVCATKLTGLNLYPTKALLLLAAWIPEDCDCCCFTCCSVKVCLDTDSWAWQYLLSAVLNPWPFMKWLQVIY